ncbi:MAG TPA: Ig-like domain-containing protein [Rhodanobacteraceae bacterium]|nr:Ig-like domain-containing protein [Rhodanobacteraceae bacterium]
MNTKAIVLCLALAAVASNAFAKPVNNPPIAGSDVIKCFPGAIASTLVSGAKSVLANDLDPEGDAIGASVFTLASHGTITLQPDGTFVYHNADPSNSSDVFTYYACDTSNACSVGTVNIVIGF